MASTPPQIFAPTRRVAVRARMHARQTRADAARYLFEDIAEDVAERLAFLRHQPARALVIGDPAGFIGKAIGAPITHADPVPGAAPLTIDLEHPWPIGAFDLIVLAFALDTANDLPGTLIHARGALAPGGLLLATMLGAGSLPALRRIMLAADGDRPSPRLHPQVDVRAAAQLLQRAGLSDPVADSRTLDVRFRSLDMLLSDLRDHGLGNVLREGGPAASKSALARAHAAFRADADADGRVTEHFELLTLSGWRPR